MTYRSARVATGVAVLGVVCYIASAGQAGAEAGAAAAGTFQTALAAAPSGQTPDAAPAASKTRFIIGLAEKTGFQVFALSQPNRVVVELDSTDLELPVLPKSGAGLVTSFRGGLSGPGRSRVIIQVSRPVIVERAEIEKPQAGAGRHLVIDIAPLSRALSHTRSPAIDTSKRSSLGATGLQPPLPAPARAPGELAKQAFKPLIVVDPGHGGHDSGAKRFGVVEKEVVLAFGKVLRDMLEATGRYRVLMTRDKDEFISLSGRVDFAEKHKAALFIAVHADYTGSSSVRGATVYSLRESVANALSRSAVEEIGNNVLTDQQREAVVNARGDVDVIREVLADLARRETLATRERTSLFSRSVVEYMKQSTNLMQNPDRSAAFRVLKTAKFPSVLIELAFVTNRKDAELLQSDSWRKRVSSSIVTAVDNYFSTQVARLPM